MSLFLLTTIRYDREQQLTSQVSVLQEELRTLQRAKIAAERQLIHYLRESRRGELGIAHSLSGTNHQSYPIYPTSLSPDQQISSEHTTGMDPVNQSNEVETMPLQLSNWEVEFLKVSTNHLLSLSTHLTSFHDTPPKYITQYYYYLTLVLI